jgi:hypothetical protein
MKLYQPMLFIGLGGTGCQVGVELELRLRDELCGPDGTDLQRSLQGSNLLPFQLPPFVQFIYADLNEAELLRAKRMVVPTDEHMPAAAYTDHFVQKLVPRYRTYPEVARSLRTNAYEESRGWLPPSDGEPRVSPLVLGAGQLPTVGRAALFETFRGGLDNVMQPLGEAIGRITKSGGELAAMGGKLENNCDVFVAFSVAGGTGAGIFYDFLHLAGHVFEESGFEAQIYPLVLMPSAFEEGHGGGRRAKLNAGRALLDLFRLVDDQNARGAATRLDASKSGGKISVRYPVLGQVRLPSATVQTAFLFSKTRGVEREDLHRSVVSFVLSLVGTSLPTDQDNAPVDRTYQSFSEQFINQGVERQVTAYTGIGNRGVSTSLVASMTVPVDDLADVISSRLLARAVEEMSAPPPGNAEENRKLIDQFYASCGLEELRTCEPEKFKEPAPARGAPAISLALSTRVKTMEARQAALESRLRTLVPQLAKDFDFRRGTLRGLTGLDVFRLQRVVAGHRNLSDPADKAGFVGSLESRRAAPPAPPGITATPPHVEALRNRLLQRKAQWADPEVRRILARQDSWYRWRAQTAWHAAWGDQAPVWDRKISQLRAEVSGLTEAFAAHAREEPASFAQRTGDLYKSRTGVSYLLPPRGDLEQFYQQAKRRFLARADLGLRPASTEAEIVTALLGSEGWRRSYELVIERGPEHGFEQAVLSVRNLIKQEVKRLFVTRGEFGEDQPLLPALRDLLAKAAGKDGPSVGDEDLAAFRRSIAALVPAGFTPQGNGDLKILVAYPQAAGDSQIEGYIEHEVNLPREPSARIQFRATDTESIVVVLLRTSMSITEVPEVREILRHWSDALRVIEPQDFLSWRQRLSYNFRWLATTEDDRVNIMHRLLCAMWNDQITLAGPRDSPEKISVRLPGDRPVSMELELRPYGNASSWASLLRAYEEWTLADGDQIRQDFCRRLMSTRPEGIERALRPASDLYQWFVGELRPAQAESLRVAAHAAPDGTRAWLEELQQFWAGTVTGAMLMPFPGLQDSLWGNLDKLPEEGNITPSPGGGMLDSGSRNSDSENGRNG